MNILVNDNKAEIYTPYNPEFVSVLKESIGSAKWNANKKCWIVPAVSVDSVRKLMIQIYGESDIEPAKHVDVKVTFDTDYAYSMCSAYTLFGKTVATAYGRDSGAKIGTDVEVIQGGAYSTGSAKNWRTQIKKGSVFIIRDVSKNLVDQWDDDEISVEVVGDAKVDKEELKKEKEMLLRRLETINSLLEDC